MIDTGSRLTQKKGEGNHAESNEKKVSKESFRNEGNL